MTFTERLFRCAETCFFYFMVFCGLLGLVVALSSCTHDRSAPVAGALSRQCQSPTVVYCDPSLDLRACESLQGALEWANGQLWSVSRMHRAAFIYGGVRAVPAELPAPNVLYVFRAPGQTKHLSEVGAMEAAVTRFRAYRDTMCRAVAVVIQVILSEDLSDGALSQLFRHELGHVLGLPHTDMPGCLMNPAHASDAESAGELCPAELNLLRAIYAP